jgi:DNA repair exonuclease SbcCD ATPase subunit
MLQLKGRVSELEAELAEQQHLGRQAMDDCEFLRTELDELKRQREDTEKAQRSLTEIESEGWGWGCGREQGRSPLCGSKAGVLTLVFRGRNRFGGTAEPRTH